MKVCQQKGLVLALVLSLYITSNAQFVTSIDYPDQHTTFYLGDTIWIKYATQGNQKRELECKLAVSGMNYNNYPRVGHADPWNHECTMNGSIPANSDYYFEFPWVVSTKCKCINVTGVQLGSECNHSANGSEKEYWWMKSEFLSNGLQNVRMYMAGYESSNVTYSDASFDVNFSQERPGGARSFREGQAVGTKPAIESPRAGYTTPHSLNVTVNNIGLIIKNGLGESFHPNGRRVTPSINNSIKSLFLE